MNEFKLSYTANEINEKLGKVDNLVSSVNGIEPDANGNVNIPNLPAVTSADNGKFLRVVDGAWSAVALQDVSEVGA